MSGTESPSKSPSNNTTGDFLNPSEELSSKKNETSSIVESNTNESLHLGSDLLADKLDYEIDEEPDELEEQDDVDLLLSSPVNEKEGTSQDVDDYDSDSKTDGASLSRIPKEDAEEGAIETSAVTITDEGKDRENKEKVDITGISSNDGQTRDDTSADVGLSINNDDKDVKSEVKEDSDKSAIGKSTEIDEDLEEGEVSDEDEEARKERLKPQPVCRFYSKGACTWGSSCRFIHPGVLDTGRSVFY